MEEKLVDARGLACPEPVVLTRKALLEAGSGRVRVMVDNEVSAENIPRLARSLGWEVRTERTGRQIDIHLDKAAGAAAEQSATAANPPQAAGTVVFVASNVFGTGDDTLGRILMRAFVKTLKDLDSRPGTVIFVNSGVWLTTKGSDLIDDLRALEAAGVRIMSCGTCLDYYKLLDALQVGVASNMYEIASTLVEADRVVRP